MRVGRGGGGAPSETPPYRGTAPGSGRRGEEEGRKGGERKKEKKKKTTRVSNLLKLLEILAGSLRSLCLLEFTTKLLCWFPEVS